MKLFDKFIQFWRLHVASAFIPSNSIVLDVGCLDGALFRMLEKKSCKGFGIDPHVLSKTTLKNATLYPGSFPEDLPANEIGAVDVITFLAVFEHIPPAKHEIIAKTCMNLLKNSGTIIITVPSPTVDCIVNILSALRIMDGTDCHQHYGMDPCVAIDTFQKAGFNLILKRKFEFGLNNLFIFKKLTT
jgi:2-polyprenyl-3-methyl-5-hydroxy-6-metoxy-1,4-benzoquinol methylase